MPLLFVHLSFNQLVGGSLSRYASCFAQKPRAHFPVRPFAGATVHWTVAKAPAHPPRPTNNHRLKRDEIGALSNRCLILARTSPSPAAQHAVLTKSRRRCALCFLYENNTEQQAGQIAHIGRDRSNHAEENLIFLCLRHHDRGGISGALPLYHVDCSLPQFTLFCFAGISMVVALTSRSPPLY